MKKFSDVSFGVIIIFIIGLLLEVYIVYENESALYSDDLSTTDTNGDGLIQRSELKQLLIKHQNELAGKFTMDKLIKNMKSGFIRGVILGTILNGLEGALCYGFVLSIVNPLVTAFEHMT